MNHKLFLTIVFSGMLAICFGQQDSTWNSWHLLTGIWGGNISGEPGRGKENFSFQFDLANHILVKKGHYEFPATANTPAVIHDDMMVVYPDASGNPSKAIYFDNLGHTINYNTISCSGKSIVLKSDKKTHFPVFRLTYTLLESGIIDSKFEIAPDGEKFNIHVEGLSKKME